MAKSKALTSFEKEMMERANQEAQAERATTASNFLSTRGGQLSYSGQPIKNNQLDCVILAAPVERMFYATRYDPDNPSGPACFALSATGVKIGPSPASADPQSQLCANCPKNEWGSSSVGKGKACRETRRLLLISKNAVDEADADSVAGLEVVGLRPPVTSVKNFSNYVQGIANIAKRPLAGVFTRITLVPDAKTQFKLKFELLEPIDDQAMIMALLKRADAEVQLALDAAAQGHGEGEDDDDGEDSKKY